MSDLSLKRRAESWEDDVCTAALQWFGQYENE